MVANRQVGSSAKCRGNRDLGNIGWAQNPRMACWVGGLANGPRELRPPGESAEIETIIPVKEPYNSGLYISIY